MTTATGIGSWPGQDAALAQRVVRDLLADGPHGLPYLPELPARGPGADMIGRAAGLLVELAVDLQPSGWRLVDRPGRDEERARAYLRRDLDDLAETFDGYTGALKLQVAGPWTLAAELRTGRGERIVADPGACRDVAQSLAAGIAEHAAEVARLLPGTRLVVQLDEPSLPAVLAGRLRTSSGYGAHRAVDREVVTRGLQEVVAGARGVAAVDRVAVHCCAPDVPLDLLRACDVDAVALDVALLDERAWEAVAEAVEAGTGLWAGIGVGAGSVLADVEPLRRAWRGLGLPERALDAVTLTASCGFADRSFEVARAEQGRIVEAARALTDVALG